MYPPTSIHYCDGKAIWLSDGTIYHDTSMLSAAAKAKNPELLAVANLPAIEEAAIVSILSVLYAGRSMELFSIDKVFSNALSRYNGKNLQNG